MNGIFLIIGGNMGNRWENLRLCRLELEKDLGTISQSSQIYESEAWGKEDEASYLNQVLLIETNKSAIDALHLCLAIEQNLGRIRQKKWEARIIDIDLLFFNHDIIHQPHLKIPHPLLQHRKFVLVPLNEIAPDFKHPQLNKTIYELLLSLNDKLEVKLYKHTDDKES